MQKGQCNLKYLSLNIKNIIICSDDILVVCIDFSLYWLKSYVNIAVSTEKEKFRKCK